MLGRIVRQNNSPLQINVNNYDINRVFVNMTRTFLEIMINLNGTKLNRFTLNQNLIGTTLIVTTLTDGIITIRNEN